MDETQALDALGALAQETRLRIVRLLVTAGPDGMAMDEAGSLFVAVSGLATVWQFSPLGEPVTRFRSCAGIRTTNVGMSSDQTARAWPLRPSRIVVTPFNTPARLPLR